MKFGIISELNMHNANYGNRLQAYALNSYLNKKYNNNYFESLYFDFYDKNYITKNYIKNYIKLNLKKMKNIFFKTNKENNMIKKRVYNANKFTFKYINLSCKSISWKDLSKLNYDAFIVGSDVVWSQVKNNIHRLRFLNFKTMKKYKKISYSASFGKNWVPKENEKILKKMLDDFDFISVREKNSLELLKKIGITNAVHTVDPTLLLKKEDWRKIEKKVVIDKKYIFVYLLGKDIDARRKISEFALKNNLLIVNIPNANEVYDKVDDVFGDIKLNDCSPEEWIYLIDNAEYIITDSFHGTVFSTIFEKKFLVFKRNTKVDINNRMTDYLSNISQSDKFVDNFENVDRMEWDYTTINNNLSNLIIFSKEYLDKAIGCVENVK